MKHFSLCRPSFIYISSASTSAAKSVLNTAVLVNVFIVLIRYKEFIYTFKARGVSLTKLSQDARLEKGQIILDSA